MIHPIEEELKTMSGVQWNIVMTMCQIGLGHSWNRIQPWHVTNPKDIIEIGLWRACHVIENDHDTD